MSVPAKTLLALAEAAGLELAAEDVEPVGEGLGRILELAAELEELPLAEVEPALGPQRWS